MTHEEWRKTVHKKLIDREMTVTSLINQMGVSHEVVHATISGRKVRPYIVEEINKILSIKGYKGV